MPAGVFCFQPMEFDLIDLIAYVGLGLIAASCWLLGGWYGVIGFVGALMLTVAAVIAYKRANA